MFKNPFSFEGRIRRTEYGLSILVYAIIVLGVSFSFEGSDQAESPIILVIFLPLAWFMIAQAAKRCHDRGNSGWWQFIPFYSLWMLFADSEPGANEYGPNPKGVGVNNPDILDEDLV